MAQIQVRHLRSQILAMSVATMLALYTIGVAMPALTPISAYATNYDDKNKNQHDDNNYKLAFLSDVEECFPNSSNYGKLFSEDVQECIIYDVMAAYFSNEHSSGSTTSDDNNESNNNYNNNERSSGSTTSDDNNESNNNYNN